jgi:uncharacterized protein YjbJ (UPF0337 family)
MMWDLYGRVQTPNASRPRLSSSTVGRPCRSQNIKENIVSMNKDQVEGRVKEAEGKIKEATGKLVGNETLEAKGKTQGVLGKVQAKYGDVKQDVKDSLKKDT